MDMSKLTIDDQIAILTLKKQIEEKQAEIKGLQTKIDEIASKGQPAGVAETQTPASYPPPAPQAQASTPIITQVPPPPAPMQIPAQPQFQQPQAPFQPQMPAAYQQPVQQVQYPSQQPNPAPYQQPMQQAPYPPPQQQFTPGQMPGLQPMYPQQPAPAPMQPMTSGQMPYAGAPAAPVMQQAPAASITKTGMKPAVGAPGKFGGGGKPARSPFFKPGAGPMHKPAQKPMNSPIAIPGMKQQAPAAPQTVSSANYQTIREHAVAALTQGGKHLTFDGLFEKMVAGGCPMPAEKPKVIVRKVLCNSPDIFSVTNKGLYTINENYAPGANATGTQPANPSAPTQQMQQPAAPVMPQPAYQPQPVPQMQPAPVAIPQQSAQMAVPQPIPQQPVVQPVIQPQPLPAAPPPPQPAPIPAPLPVVPPPPQPVPAPAPVAIPPQPVPTPAPAPVVQTPPPQPEPLPIAVAIPVTHATAKPITVKAIPVATPTPVEVHQKKHTVHTTSHKPAEAQHPTVSAKPTTVPPPRRTAVVPPPRRTEKVQPAPIYGTAADDLDSSLEGLDTTARRALTSSGQGSIRERATSAILNAGRPLNIEEVFDKLKVDGNSLPHHNAKDVIKTVLNNKSLFKVVDNGKYLPISD